MTTSTRIRPRPATLALACVCLAMLAWTPQPAQARAKKLAMKHFDVGSRDVKVIASAKVPRRGAKVGAALVRLQDQAVPVCHLLILNAAPRSATRIVKAIRLPVCAAYDKHARAARLKRVDFTTSRGAYLVSVFSKRMDAIAKGAETRRFWGLYADHRSGAQAVFERTSTSFASHVNKEINQAEVCEAPVYAVSDRPSSLTIVCKTQTVLASAINTKTITFRYQWKNGRFARR